MQSLCRVCGKSCFDFDKIENVSEDNHIIMTFENQEYYHDICIEKELKIQD